MHLQQCAAWTPLRSTAGVGENDKITRKKVCDYLAFLGIGIDDEANSKRGQEIVISTPDSKVSVLVIPTNEELAIARRNTCVSEISITEWVKLAYIVILIHVNAGFSPGFRMAVNGLGQDIG